ncbi:putative concanavalin A-like lectin/glucanase domain-containing protein, partial [Tanacetum coccineum]
YFLTANSSVTDVSDYLEKCYYHIDVPVSQSLANQLAQVTSTMDDLQSALRAGFELRWANFTECDQCIRSNGQCGSNSTSPELFVCYCASGNFSRTCDNRSNRSVDEGM